MTKGLESAKKSKGLGNLYRGLALGTWLAASSILPINSHAQDEDLSDLVKEMDENNKIQITSVEKTPRMLNLRGDLGLEHFNSSEYNSATECQISGDGTNLNADLYADYNKNKKISPSAHLIFLNEDTDASMRYTADIAFLKGNSKNLTFAAGVNINLSKDGKDCGAVTPRIGLALENKSFDINVVGFGGIAHSENYNSGLFEIGYENNLCSLLAKYSRGKGKITDNVLFANYINEEEKYVSEFYLEAVAKKPMKKNDSQVKLKLGSKYYGSSEHVYAAGEVLVPASRNINLLFGVESRDVRADGYQTNHQMKYYIGAKCRLNGNYNLRNLFRGKQKK